MNFSKIFRENINEAVKISSKAAKENAQRLAAEGGKPKAVKEFEARYDSAKKSLKEIERLMKALEKEMGEKPFDFNIVRLMTDVDMELQRVANLLK